VTTTTTTQLRDALLSSYPDAALFGAPVIAANRDDTTAAWTWLLGIVRKRSDLWPAIGIAIQHAANDGGDLAREALADFLESYQHSFVLLEWTAPLAKVWPDAKATCRGTSFGQPDYRLATIVAAQRALKDEVDKDTRIAVEGAGPNGDYLIVDVQSQTDLESLMATSAKVGKHGDRGEGPWHWLLGAVLFRPELEPMLVAACAQFASGTDAEVRALLDWFFAEHDLWRYLSLLDSWSQQPPSWWNAPADTVPPGWRFPVRAEGAKTLGEIALRALRRAREQAAAQVIIDLPRLY
jgi:hypothetical protein